MNRPALLGLWSL